MQAGTALIGRRLLAILVAFCMAVSVVLLFARPAEAEIPATGPVPSNCVEFGSGDLGSQSPSGFGSNVTFEFLSWTETAQDPHIAKFSISGLTDVQEVHISVKAGQDVEEDGPYDNGTYTVMTDDHGISHIRLCVSEFAPRKGKIVVRKEVTEQSNTTVMFDFNASYDQDGFSLSDGQENHSGWIEPGAYDVSEVVPDGWSLLSATCESNQGSDESTPSSIDLGKGEIITCTFLNDETQAPPSGYACVDGQVEFIEDATDFEGTLYETAQEAADDPNCIEVDASTTFTVVGSCAVVDGAGVFTISGNLGEGVTLEVAGETFDSVGAFSTDVGSAGAYPYEVTLDEGFVLAEGSPATEGSIGIADCVPPVPPSGWVCVGGSVDFIADATDFDGTLYDTEAEAENAEGCSEEVMASIVVTVEGSCSTADADTGVIDVTVSVADGATVEVRDSDGDVVGTFTQDGSVEVPADETYTWTATPNEGFEFPVGSATSGTVTIDSCIDVLPFTGVNSDLLAMIAAALGLMGTGILFATRRMEEN